jgi:hypothetical protein
METVKYLCEFFFCEGWDSFVRLVILGILFSCLAPKHNTYIGLGDEKDE